MNTIKIVEEVEQFAGTKKVHNFDFTNSMAVSDTGLTGTTVTAKPTGTGITVDKAASGLLVQVTVDAEAVTAAYQNVELLVEVYAKGATSGLSDILKKRVKFVGKIQ